jgi:hypothetical protein
MTQRLSLPAAVLLFLCGHSSIFSQPAHAAQEYDLDVLLMGNSMVRGIKRPLGKMFAAQGLNVRIKAAAPGLQDLQFHSESRRSDKIIHTRDWDVVFLQQKSTGLAEAEGGYNAVRVLFDKIQSTGAQTVLFMTWRERSIHPLNPSWDWLKGEPGDEIGYVPIAWELGIGVAPVGWAVREARIRMGDAPTIDLWKGNKGRHLSDLGHYLGACVVYATLTGESPRGLWFADRLGPEITDFLQTIALEVVFGADNGTWNLE